MAEKYKDKKILAATYEELGSTRHVGRYFGVCNGTICYWMKKFGLPRIPKLHFFKNNSGRGRMGELYILGHPYFKKDVVDAALIDDKHPVDLTWKNNRVNVKTSHYSRPIFCIKVKRHKVSFYICLYYVDTISELIPVEVWVIPSNIARHSGITTSLTSLRSKYHRFKLSLKRGIDFSVAEEEKYNKKFIRKYSKIYGKGKRGDEK